jgi:hypothetical protein
MLKILGTIVQHLVARATRRPDLYTSDIHNIMQAVPTHCAMDNIEFIQNSPLLKLSKVILVQCMKEYRGMEVSLRSFLISTTWGVISFTSRSFCLPPCKPLYPLKWASDQV